MTTYILLLNWTEQGARDVRNSPKRLDAAKKQLGDMGGEFKAFYLTMGAYDMVAVVEAPDDAVIAQGLQGFAERAAREQDLRRARLELERDLARDETEVERYENRPELRRREKRLEHVAAVVEECRDAVAAGNAEACKPLREPARARVQRLIRELAPAEAHQAPPGSTH